MSILVKWGITDLNKMLHTISAFEYEVKIKKMHFRICLLGILTKLTTIGV